AQLQPRPAQPGEQLRLSVDYNVQQAGQQALAGGKAAFVAMDVQTGEIRGLGSAPSFDPNIFSKTIKQSDLDRLSSQANGAPLFDRATQSAYPTGSTFKLITATAALQGGVITPDTVEYDGGSLNVGGTVFKNAGGAVNGALSLRDALRVSSDVFFYRLGLELNSAGDGHGLQRWAHMFGLGHRTGIAVGGEGPGLVPSPEWRNRLYRKHLTDRPWSVGDNINLAVGQGDVGVSPLQLAVAYATLANGGYVVTPHIGMRVEDSDGRVLQEIAPGPKRRLDISPVTRDAILSGLRAAANDPGGTSEPVFRGFPIEVAGKTGTAERGPQ